MLFCFNSQSLVLVMGVSSYWSLSLPQEETFCRRCSQALRSAELSRAVGVFTRICSAVSWARNLSMRERGVLLPPRGAVPARHGAPRGLHSRLCQLLHTTCTGNGDQPPSFISWDAARAWIALFHPIHSDFSINGRAPCICLQHPNVH